VSTIKELLERQSSSSGLENLNYVRRGSVTLSMRHPSNSKKLALSWPTSGSPSIGIVRSRTQATEFVFLLFVFVLYATLRKKHLTVQSPVVTYHLL
jgi:hypothetical protein